MKVLSIRQPWAYLIVAGYKDIENRKWYTNHRGPLLIHASKAVDPNDFPKQRQWIREAGIVIPNDNDLPRGAIVVSANLTEVYSDGRDDRLLDIYDSKNNPWFEGPYGFLMTDPVEFEDPIQCRGQLGIRDVSDSLMARVSKMLTK